MRSHFIGVLFFTFWSSPVYLGLGPDQWRKGGRQQNNHLVRGSYNNIFILSGFCPFLRYHSISFCIDTRLVVFYCRSTLVWVGFLHCLNIENIAFLSVHLLIFLWDPSERPVGSSMLKLQSKPNPLLRTRNLSGNPVS